MGVRGMRWIGAGLVVVALAVVAIVAASGTSKDDAVAPDVKPATVVPIKGTGISRVTLSPDAARRLGIETAPVQAGGRGGVIPYAAVLYDPSGQTFTYTSPRPRVFERQMIDVIRIDGARALLRSGPPAGMAVVTVGSQELFGSEYEVEED